MFITPGSRSGKGSRLHGQNLTIKTENISVNLFCNSSILQISNSTFLANLTIANLQIGSSTVNSTAHIAGANVYFDTVKMFFGNTIANSLSNSVIFQVANSVQTTNVTADGIKVGANTIANAAGFFGNGAGLTSITATAAPAGANTQVQFNDSGATGASAGFVFDKTSNIVSVSNAVLIGSVTSYPVNPANAVIVPFQIHNLTQALSVAYTWNATGTTGSIIGGGHSRGATVGTRGVMSSGDVLLNIHGYGDNGLDFIAAARIRFVVDGTANSTQMPGHLSFWTTPPGSNTPSERMRIDSGANVGIRTTAPAYTLQVNGDFSSNTIFVGNSTANVFSNSILISAANSTATTNVTPDGMKVGTTIANTAGFFGNGAGLTSIAVAITGVVDIRTATATITIPTGATKLKVTLIGGGGGGGGAAVGGCAAGTGGKGGPGGVVVKYLSGLTPGNTLALTIGAAGSAGASTPAAGGNGGDTTLASGSQSITTLTASKGIGGSAGTGAQGAAGASGTGTNGDLNITGVAGGVSGLSLGIPGEPRTSDANGNPGNGYGGGGGGGQTATTNKTGGAGTAGAAIFEWYP